MVKKHIANNVNEKKLYFLYNRMKTHLFNFLWLYWMKNILKVQYTWSVWMCSFAYVCFHVWPTISVCVCVAQGCAEETESMIPQSSTPRLRRCGYCLLQVTSRCCRLSVYVFYALTCVIPQQLHAPCCILSHFQLKHRCSVRCRVIW